MSKSKHQTAPDPKEKGWPKGVPYIIGNEGCERYSYYGMRAILYLYVVYLYETVGGHGDGFANIEATKVVHDFGAAVYALPMIGALIADRLLGKYHTILWLSGVYSLGHLVLSLTEGTFMGLYVGLGLIAVGSGGIKPCVSAHVGDQFGKGNWNLLQKIYQIFYFIINFGSFFATILTPWTREAFGWTVAFAVPGVLMFIATVVFWMGRKTFVHVPAKPGGFLGLLDVLSGSFLFFAMWFPIFAPADLVTSPTRYILAPICFIAGYAIFKIRQQKVPDDGFLAVLDYAVLSKLGFRMNHRAVAAGVGVEVSIKGMDGSFGDVPSSKNANQPFTTSPMHKGTLSASSSSTNLKKHYTDDIAKKAPLTGSGEEHGVPAFFKPALERFGREPIDGAIALFKIMSIFVFIAVFWALFDQHSSTWIRQATMMNLVINLPIFGQWTLTADQIPALNPLMVMILIPICSAAYSGVESKGVRATPLRRMSLGMFVASLAFVSVAIIQGWIDAGIVTGTKVSVLWQVVPYLIITTAEVLVSITGLEFAYSQAPKRMKSLVMGFWLLTVAIGHKLVVFLAGFEDLALVDFFWVFAALMAGAGLLFGMRAKFYTPREFSQ